MIVADSDEAEAADSNWTFFSLMCGNSENQLFCWWTSRAVNASDRPTPPFSKSWKSSPAQWWQCCHGNGERVEPGTPDRVFLTAQREHGLASPRRNRTKTLQIEGAECNSLLLDPPRDPNSPNFSSFFIVFIIKYRWGFLYHSSGDSLHPFQQFSEITCVQTPPAPLLAAISSLSFAGLSFGTWGSSSSLQLNGREIQRLGKPRHHSLSAFLWTAHNFGTI